MQITNLPFWPLPYMVILDKNLIWWGESRDHEQREAKANTTPMCMKSPRGGRAEKDMLLQDFLGHY
jgi:hypothetical protein